MRILTNDTETLGELIDQFLLRMHAEDVAVVIRMLEREHDILTQEDEIKIPSRGMCAELHE